MTYRDDLEAKRLRRDAIRQELDAVHRQVEQMSSLRARARELEGELRNASDGVDRARAKVALPLLAKVRVASPCKARWDEMVGDDHVRHCGQCDKDVYDLSSLEAARAEALLRERTGSLCVRFYRRRDGTILTADCPVGAKQKRRKRVGIAAAVATSLMAGAAFGADALLTQGEPAPLIMGAMVAPDEYVMGEESPVDEYPVDEAMGGLEEWPEDQEDAAR